VDLLYKGKSQYLDQIFCENNKETQALAEISNIQLKHIDESFYEISISDFDSACQNDWLMPEEYKTMDIAKWVLDQCKDQDQLQRVGAELLEFQRRNMMDLLRWLKYFVDYCRDNKILWGVGRGSSVASYVLYLLKLHRVDSLHYNLDIAEFLR
jgi:DNA polymerase III alpha subunit